MIMDVGRDMPNLLNKISPSILTADFAILGEQIKELEANGIQKLHIDIMDGHFVDNISFGLPILSSIRKITKMFLDVHLMISKPRHFAERFIQAGADSLTFHYEACQNSDEIFETIRLIKRHKRGVGIAINPETNIENIFEFLGEIDLALIMTVNPGQGRQKIIESTLDKAIALKNHSQYDVKTQIDGGVNAQTLPFILEKPIDDYVMGSAIFDGNITQNIKKISLF